MLTPPEFDPNRKGLEDLEDLVRLAENAAVVGQTGEFYTALRHSEVPFLLQNHGDDPESLLLASLTALHSLGQASPGLALGVSQHIATMLAIGLCGPLLATHPAAGPVIQDLISESFSKRLLIANTTSQGGGRKIGAKGSRIFPENDGYRIEGHSTYMSLATFAQKIVFLTYDEAGSLVGVVTDTGVPNLDISEELLFGDNLILADTRRVSFNGLHVPPTAVFGPDPSLNVFYTLQLVCHNLCVSALYLGGARRILDEVKRYGRASSLPSGQALSTSDSYSADTGRLVISYLNAIDLILAQTPLVCSLATRPKSAASALLRVSTAKHGVARHIEHIATEGRKLIGARAFMGEHPVARIGGEIVFAALGPATEKLIERNAGAKFLKADGDDR